MRLLLQHYSVLRLAGEAPKSLSPCDKDEEIVSQREIHSKERKSNMYKLCRKKRERIYESVKNVDVSHVTKTMFT